MPSKTRKGRPGSRPSGKALVWGAAMAVVVGGLLAALLVLREPAEPVAPGDAIPSGPRPALDDPARIAAGATLFATNCAPCHGAGAAGENPALPGGGQKADGSYWAPALNGNGHAWHHPPEGLIRVIRDGSPARGSTMIGWRDRLSPDEMWSIIAYFSSLWPDKIKRNYREAFLRRDQ